MMFRFAVANAAKTGDVAATARAIAPSLKKGWTLESWERNVDKRPKLYGRNGKATVLKAVARLAKPRKSSTVKSSKKTRKNRLGRGCR